MRSIKACVAVGFLAALVGCATPEVSDPIEPMLVAQVSGAIKGGETDKFSHAVVGLVHVDGWGIGSCTGTLIAPNVVLTAQHCVASIISESEGIDCAKDTFASAHAASNLYVTTQWTLTQNPNDYHNSVEVLIPTGGHGANWGADNLVCGNDIALLVLSQAVSPDEATPLTPRVDDPLLTGSVYSAVGYGATNQSGSGSGTRRRLDGRTGACVADECPSYFVKTQEWIGEKGLCQGDSGGPAIDEEGRVVGVASRAGWQCSSPVYTYVTAWGDWIRESVLYASAKIGLEPPAWALGWPTDPAYSHPIGGDCVSAGDCASGVCEGGVCTRSCNAAAPCPEPYTCGPEGTCILPSLGQDCTDDSACPGGLCDLSIGLCTRTCAEDAPCPPGYGCDAGVCGLLPVGASCFDAGDCAEGSQCVAGECTRHCSDEAPCPAGSICGDDALCDPDWMGSSCSSDEQCLEGTCFLGEGVCVRACDALGICPDGFACDGGTCAPIAVGDVCLASVDCPEGGICGGDSVCTRRCNELGPCPPGMGCDLFLGRCFDVPLGQSCTSDAECLDGGLCDAGACTVACHPVEATCPGDYSCGDAGICEAPAPPVIEGCSTSSSPAGPLGGALLLWAIWFARRARRGLFKPVPVRPGQGSREFRSR